MGKYINIKVINKNKLILNTKHMKTRIEKKQKSKKTKAALLLLLATIITIIAYASIIVLIWNYGHHEKAFALCLLSLLMITLLLPRWVKSCYSSFQRIVKPTKTIHQYVEDW